MSVTTWGGTSAGSAVPVRRRLHDRGDHLGDVFAGERARAGEHLVEHGAKRPDVGALVDGPTARLLRRHVRRRPEDHAHPGHRRGARQRRRLRRIVRRLARPCRLGELRQPEVQHLHGAVFPHLDVGRLQIAMDDALLVRRFERGGDLPRDRQRFVDWDAGPCAMRSASVGPSTSSITSAFTPSAVVFEPVDRRDVRVIQRGEDFGLALKARQPVGSAASAGGRILMAT